MIKNVDEYLDKLRQELKGCDRALVQDALSDAEEHLRTALENELKTNTKITEAEALASIIEKYGTPEETTASYREIEARFEPTLAPSRKHEARSFLGEFFGVAADPRAWGAFLYLLLGLLTGCFYGMWMLFGSGLSIVTLPLIIGLPVTGLFFLSVRGIALMEGRIVEALLGMRMPRKPLFVKENLGWKGKFFSLVKDPQSWKALVYLFLHFPLGAVYSVMMFVFFSFSIKFAIYPVWYFTLNRPLLTIGQPIFPPGWMFPLISITGILMLFSTLHLAKAIGTVHGRYAKAMLVRK